MEGGGWSLLPSSCGQFPMRFSQLAIQTQRDNPSVRALEGLSRWVWMASWEKRMGNWPQEEGSKLHPPPSILYISILCSLFRWGFAQGRDRIRRRIRAQLQVDLVFHADLPAKEPAVFGHKGGRNHIPPDPAGGADLEFLRGDVAAHGAGHNHVIGADIFTGDAAALAHHQHAAQGDLPFEGALDAHTARAGDLAFPDDARPEHGRDAFHGLHDGRGGELSCCRISFKHSSPSGCK